MSATRSPLALTRLLGIPYAALLALYLGVLGGGELWLHRELRAAEAELQVERLLASVDPVATRFAVPDGFEAAREPDAALLAEVGTLFADLDELEAVSLRDASGGWLAEGAPGLAGALPRVRAIPGEDVAGTVRPDAARRLARTSDEPLFLLRFDLEGGENGPARLDFALRRDVLLERIDEALSGLRRALAALALLGTAGIVACALVTVRAMGATRRLEGHYQTVYRRAALAETAAGVVHDLRSPLAAIRANLAALRLDVAERDAVLAELDQDVLALDERLGSFLDMARSRTGAPEPTDPAGLVREAVRLARPVLARRGLTVEIELPDTLPEVPLRRTALQDALVNLIINAASSGQRAGPVRVGASADDDVLELWVEDDGDGFDEADLPHLLEPFYTTRENGSGLGLANARRALAAHGGDVCVRNRLEGGVRAVLVLPRRIEENPRWWRRPRRPFPT